MVGPVLAFVAFYVHGIGRGHANRARAAVTELLARGHEIRLHAGGEARGLLTDVAALQRREPLLPGPSIAWRLPLRALSDRRALSTRRPDVIVSDGDHGAVIAGRTLGIPVVACGHDMVFNSCVLPSGLPRAALAYQRLNMLPTELTSFRVPVHFLPIEARHRNVRVARPDLPAELQGETSDEDFVLGYFSGGVSGAAVTELAEGPVAKAGLRWKCFGGRSFDREAFRAALLSCRAVIASAGSNLLAECVCLGKPLLAIYRSRHREQKLNAVLAEQARVAMTCPLPEFRADPALVVERFLRDVESHAFAHVDLLSALDPVSQVVADRVESLSA